MSRVKLLVWLLVCISVSLLFLSCGSDDEDASDETGRIPLTCQSDKCSNDLGMTFNRIPAGTFTMGSPPSELGRENGELEHQVTLTKDFYIMTTEVTQKQWMDIMGSNPSSYAECGYDCPVESVSWDDIQEFIFEMNDLYEGTYRLPTEAEWEYAAKAGSTTAFANGDITVEGGCFTIDLNLDEMGWYCINSDNTTHPVSQKKANDWGLFDMHGNVQEWCQDIWSDSHQTAPVIDPTGPSDGNDTYRVIRGGGFNSSTDECRSASRSRRSSYSSFKICGFRLVVEPN